MKVEDLNQEVKDKVMQLLMMHRQRKIRSNYAVNQDDAGSYA